jgi:hypothetical protein
MNDDFDVLPADVRAMLRAERTGMSVPENARARLANRLSAALPGFGPPLSPTVTVAAPHSALTATAAKVFVAMALGGGAMATYKAIDQPSPRHAPRVNAVVAEDIAPVAKREVVEEHDLTIPALPVPAPKSAASAASSVRTPTASLREERRLLDAARDAIVRGEPAGALAATANHAARFPRGVLAEEREALRIRALARLGRMAEARSLLAELRVAHPHSFLLAGAAADVEAIP